MRAQTVLVLNLATGEELHYVALEPTEALISAAILHDKRAGDLTNSYVRERYAKRITQSTKTASIGDLAVKL